MQNASTNPRLKSQTRAVHSAGSCGKAERSAESETPVPPSSTMASMIGLAACSTRVVRKRKRSTNKTAMSASMPEESTSSVTYA